MRVVLPFKLVGQKLVKGRDFPKSIADGSKNTIVVKVDGLPENVITKAYFKLSWENNKVYDLTFNGNEVVVEEYILTLPAHANNKYVEHKISMSVAIFDGNEERLTTEAVELLLNKSNYSDETTNTPELPESQYEALLEEIKEIVSGGGGNGEGGGGVSIVVDDDLDINSKNPVQNKIVTKNFQNLNDRVQTLENNGGITVDDALSNNSTNPVQNKVVNEAFTNVNTRLENLERNGGGEAGADGEDGATFTPAVSADGVLSWTNDKGLTNPTPVNIKGATGAAGSTGATGNGISSITKTGTSGLVDTYTITFTNGSKTTFTVTNGQNGATGQTGQTGVAGSDGVGVASVVQTTTSSADGGTNVITVTLTDGTKATFNVKNGSKGSTGADGYTPVKGVDYFDGTDGINGADGKTPVKGVDYYTDADKEEIETYITTELAKRGQLAPEYANSVDECTDTSKMYVLPDGFIYAYMLTEVESGPSYTNQLPLAVDSGGGEYVGDNGEDGYRVGYRVSSSGTEKAATGFECTGFIPAKQGDTIRVKNITTITATNDGSGYASNYFFDSAFAKTNGAVQMKSLTPDANGVYSFAVPDYSSIAYVRLTLKGTSANTIVTVNEEITEGGGGTTTAYAWASTGHAFVPADYEDRIVDLETQTEQNTADIAKLKAGVTDDDLDPLERIKKWDAPIYDANIPVFQLTTEKAAITEAEKTVAAVYAKYDALMARHPNYITKTNLGMCSDGVTPVYRYDFREPEPHRGTTGKKEWSETKSKAIIVSGIHWEWGGIFALYNALEEVAENPALYHLRRNTHLIVLPVCNPYAVSNMSVRNANQVEIHRNFEVDFIYPNEAGYIPIGERSHGGTAPLSEVETQYIDNIFKANTDAAFFLTCHSNQSDTVYGTGFTWASPATYYMCNMHYRIVDKLSAAWMEKYGDELAAGIADYRTENTPEWDNRLGSAYLSTTNGTETKQATKYGIQATNIEVTDAFLTHGTKANPEPALSSFTMSRGAEVYANFLLTAFGCYDHKDKKQYHK